MAIEFLSGQAILRPGAKEILDRFGQALNDPQLKNFRFLIEGHTDTVGTAEYNRELSAQRAQVVADHLRERGVLPARLETAGHGFDHPAVRTGPQVSEPRNRRVKIVRLGN